MDSLTLSLPVTSFIRLVSFQGFSPRMNVELPKTPAPLLHILGKRPESERELGQISAEGGDPELDHDARRRRPESDPAAADDQVGERCAEPPKEASVHLSERCCSAVLLCIVMQLDRSCQNALRVFTCTTHQDARLLTSRLALFLSRQCASPTSTAANARGMSATPRLMRSWETGPPAPDPRYPSNHHHPPPHPTCRFCVPLSALERLRSRLKSGSSLSCRGVARGYPFLVPSALFACDCAQHGRVRALPSPIAFCTHVALCIPLPRPARGRVLTPLNALASGLLAISAGAADQMILLISMPG